MGATLAHRRRQSCSRRCVGRLPGASRGGRRRRPGHRVQRADRRRGVRPGRAGAAASSTASRSPRFGASATAIAVARVLLGDAPDFTFALDHRALPRRDPLFLVLGAVAGLLASRLQPRAARDHRGRRSAGPGGPSEGARRADRRRRRAAGVVARAGRRRRRAHAAHASSGDEPLACLPVVFLLRFGARAGLLRRATPGGLFAPLLVLGAQSGLALRAPAALPVPGLGIDPAAFAVVGMAAFFTGVVRAPLTGIVLVIEMTAAVTHAPADARRVLRGYARPNAAVRSAALQFLA